MLVGSVSGFPSDATRTSCLGLESLHSLPLEARKWVWDPIHSIPWTSFYPESSEPFGSVAGPRFVFFRLFLAGTAAEPLANREAKPGLADSLFVRFHRHLSAQFRV